jgi:hypothetical protein
MKRLADPYRDLEVSRAPRFNQATIGILSALAAATGFCTGCEAYKLGSRLVGRPFVSCPLPPQPASGAD